MRDVHFIDKITIVHIFAVRKTNKTKQTTNTKK